MGTVAADFHERRRCSAAGVILRFAATAALALLVAGVAGASPAWHQPVQLSPAERALGPELALNAAGGAVVVWDHEQGADCPTQPASLSCIHIVEAAPRSSRGSAWQSPIEVARPGIGAAPRLAVDPAGDSAIVWIHDIGQPRVLQATIRPAGAATWPNANDLSGMPLEIRNHAIALDNGGNAVAVWAQRDATTFYVVGDLRPAAGGVWLAPVALSSIGADASAGPALSLAPSGEALAAWIDSGALRLARGNAASGVWDRPVSPAFGGVNADTDVDVALNDSGAAVAAWSWRRAPRGPSIVQASFRNAGGGWGRVVDLGTAGDGRSSVRTGLSGNGAAAVVWLNGTTLNGSGRSRTTGAWTSPRTIATNVADSGARLAMNPAGNAVAVWANRATGAIRAALRPAGSAWQPPARVSGAGSFEPRIALDAASAAVAVWNRTAAQRVLVESADLAPTGPVLTNLQVPAKTTVGVKASFSVSPRAWNAPLAGPPLWRFGDGTSTTGAQVGHTFGGSGTFTVSVTQRDAAGDVSTSSGKVSVGAR
jgi:PKD domain-containing protein